MRKPSAAVASLIALVGSPAFAQGVQPDEPAPQEVAQETGSGSERTTVYPASFFASYAPRTALDIARRVPGFSLDLGNSDARGFAAAAGNVVINGVRPSSKSESLETTLSRIPARSVVRVEVGPGDLYGAEYSGRNQVLNVLLSSESGINGNVTVSARRTFTDRVTPNVSGSMMIKRGASTINLSATTGNTYRIDEGTDVLTNVATGDLIEFRRKSNEYDTREPSISGSWALERASDKSMRVNARWQPGRFDLFQDNRVFPAGGDPHDDNLIQDYSYPVFELGGDITRPLAGGAIKLVALATRRKRENFDSYVARDGLLSEGANVVGGFEQLQESKTGETIGRLSWSHSDVAGFSVEAGGEAVLNTLESDVDLFVIRPSGEKVRIDLPIDSARVEEKRGEIYLNAGRNLSPALRLDAGLTYEYSDLAVSGDAQAERQLTFLKPNATLDWKAGDGWHAQLAVRRTVAQLNFSDFISSAELSNDRVSAGNENLVPQRAWEFRATIDRPILGDGLAKVELGHDLISLLQDRVLIFDNQGKGFDAPGNIGTGKRYFARLTIDAPLGKLWSGLRANFSGQVQRTRVEDPISGEMRNFSGFYPDWEWELNVRRDQGDWSYGMNLSDRDRFTFFRTDEFDTNANDQPFMNAFVEYRPDSRTAMTFDVENVLETGGFRERLLFIPQRAAPQTALREFRERNNHIGLKLTFKRSFSSGGSASAAGVARDS